MNSLVQSEIVDSQEVPELLVSEIHRAVLNHAESKDSWNIVLHAWPASKYAKFIPAAIWLYPEYKHLFAEMDIQVAPNLSILTTGLNAISKTSIRKVAHQLKTVMTESVEQRTAMQPTTIALPHTLSLAVRWEISVIVESTWRNICDRKSHLNPDHWQGVIPRWQWKDVKQQWIQANPHSVRVMELPTLFKVLVMGQSMQDVLHGCSASMIRQFEQLAGELVRIANSVQLPPLGQSTRLAIELANMHSVDVPFYLSGWLHNLIDSSTPDGEIFSEMMDVQHED